MKGMNEPSLVFLYRWINSIVVGISTSENRRLNYSSVDKMKVCLFVGDSSAEVEVDV
jgi:hypothetical protein